MRRGRMVAQVLGMDEPVRDSVLFDRGGLARCLTTRASESLLARVPLVGSWACARRSVFQIGEVEDDRLVVTDLVTRRQHTLLHLGAAVGSSRTPVWSGGWRRAGSSRRRCSDRCD